MKSTFIGKENNEANFKMEFTSEDFEGALQKAYQANKGRYAVDGFRKGKAPRKLIERKYGEGVFYEEAINQLFSANYPQCIDEIGVEPVDQPRIDFSEIEAGKGFDITVKVTIKPEFEIKDYKGVKVPKIDVTITDEDVDKDIDSIRKRNSRMIVVERPAKEGDTLLIDYKGFVGDNQFQGGTAERQPITIGSGTFIPGFEEQLIGAELGEDRDVKVTFPEDYPVEDLAGKEAVFHCSIHEIKENELPELNDEFVKDVSEFDTLEELRKDVRAKLEKIAADKAENDTKNAILQKIYDANEIEIPEVMIQEEIDEMLNNLASQLENQGMNMEQYLDFSQKDMTSFRQEIHPDAFKRIKTKLLVEAVAKAEDIKVTGEEIDEEMKKMAQMYGFAIDQLRQAMGIEGILLLQNDIINQKAIDFLVENSVIEG
ncbi:MAG: trigger factor [Anaerovoracaceae bacterium]